MNICVFCGSSFGTRPEYERAAATLGKELAHRGLGVVYGGASVGLMGAVANAALEVGGSVIGVIPQALADVEIAHEGLTELKIVADMHERKAQMSALSDAFIALPGGIGTLEETFEIMTWTQLGIHSKPIGLLNVEAYYEGLAAFLDHQVNEAFVKQLHRDILVIGSDVQTLIDRLLAVEMPVAGKWV